MIRNSLSILFRFFQAYTSTERHSYPSKLRSSSIHLSLHLTFLCLSVSLSVCFHLLCVFHELMRYLKLANLYLFANSSVHGFNFYFDKIIFFPPFSMYLIYLLQITYLSLLVFFNSFLFAHVSLFHLFHVTFFIFFKPFSLFLHLYTISNVSIFIWGFSVCLSI